MFVFVTNIHIDTVDIAASGSLIISSVNYNSSNGDINVIVQDTTGVVYSTTVTLLTVYYID